MTTQAKHTPGPWYAQGCIISPTPTGKRFAIAEVFRDNVETADANARLIAAAPALLEALQAMVAKRLGDDRFSPQGFDQWQIWADQYRNDPKVDKVLLQAVAAIQSATLNQ